MLSLLLSVVAALGVAAPAWAGDLALNRPASASSAERGLAQYSPARANDGNSATRWSSAYSDNQWWQVDLGSDRTVNRVELNWEAAYASRYRIQTRRSRSNSWSTAANVSIDSWGWQRNTFAARSARYVRIRGDVRATPWGISLWDARVCDNATCGGPGPEPTPTPTPTPTPDPTATPTPTPPPAGTPTATPTAGPPPAGAPTLQQVDGGTGYYGQFSNALPTSADYFPIGVWGSYNLSQANIALDKSVGLNMYVWIGGNPPEDSALARLRASGMYALHFIDQAGAYPSRGSESVGWITADEIDMQQANPAGAAAARAVLNTRLAGKSNDGRLAYSNYGKGVMFWNSDSDAEQYVNDFQQLTSIDIYWFTDNDVCTQWQGGPYFGKPSGVALTTAECRRASNYGVTVDRLRELDAMDGRRQPLWNFVEVGCPFSNVAQGAGNCIQSAQIRAAVWHSIIAGARGIEYFQHSFSGSCQTHYVLRSSCGNYPAVGATVTETNMQIRQLAPVLNAPSVTSDTTTSSGVRALYKWHDGHFYVIAGNRENANTTGTMGLPCIGDGATAVNLGETVGNMSIPVQGGQFTDTFQDGNAIHIYRIDGGSRCGL